MSLWKKIAKNEIRLKTFRVRKNRKLFFIIIYTLFLIWAAYLGPILFDEILPELLKFYSEHLEVLISLILEYSFMMLFMMYMIYPLFILNRRSEIGIKDTVLASPIKSGDIFLGEFVGQLPFYFLFLLGIGPLGTSLLRQINSDMIFLHYLGFYIFVFILSNFALIIGMIFSNWFENKIFKNKKIRELDSWILVLLSFLVISIFYVFHFIFEIIAMFPNLKIWMLFFPSFWYSNIVLYTVKPSLVSSYILNLGLNVSLAVLIPFFILIISYKKAGNFYTLERTIDKKSKRIHQDHIFYRFIGKLTPLKWKGLIITHFKEFLRKRENYAKLIYCTVFIGFIGFFLSLSLKDSTILLEDNPLNVPLLFEIFHHRFLLVLIIGWIGSLIFSILIGISVLIKSKELLFLYKKSPRGLNSLLFSYLYVIFDILFFLDIILTIYFAILFQLNFLQIFMFFFMFMLNSIVILLEALAIQCIKPLFEERGKDVFFNIYLLIIFQITSLLITLFLVMPFYSPLLNVSIGIIVILLINLIVSGIISALALYLGILKLNKIE
ncbi:MAG: hypothetical protein ACFE8B_01590 [Candidatus Hermodarchaeota archaeon]